MLIAIDAGHGGKDPGAAANGLVEKDIALVLALKTGAYLRTHYDCDVMYTRNKDVFLPLSERANIANRAKADLFCSFHINSFNSSSQGFETYRYPGTTGQTIELQKAVAAIEKLTGQTISWAGAPARSDEAEPREQKHRGGRRERGGPHPQKKKSAPPPAPVTRIDEARPRRQPEPKHERKEDSDNSHLPAFLLRPVRVKA